ncbi:hypothetical protein ATANTOWER_031457 [Ataeniobius toweri]|uniref:Uncharacterized protein n=1 Tax=Ataeniobius toweri TaxID=208326 RepID=A0ABU7AMR7_9TELE|nr:hypothetical protein [Ataeniobius toweri]
MKRDTDDLCGGRNVCCCRRCRCKVTRQNIFPPSATAALVNSKMEGDFPVQTTTESPASLLRAGKTATPGLLLIMRANTICWNFYKVEGHKKKVRQSRCPPP